MEEDAVASHPNAYPISFQCQAPTRSEHPLTSSVAPATQVTPSILTQAATGDLRSHFRVVSRQERRRQTHRAFRSHSAHLAARSRQLRPPKQQQGRHTLLRTQNVRGFVKDGRRPEMWFNLFRAKEDGELPAITLVQETHVVQGEASELQRRYRCSWGFNLHAAPMSFWSETATRAAGVGILVNPYTVRNAEPAHITLWSGNFLSITCDLEGQRALVMVIYAPSSPTEREAFFHKLADYKLQHAGPVIVGGDFNCSIHPGLDRSFSSSGNGHYSAGLARWIHEWHLTDALSPVFPPEDSGEDELIQFQADQHTYRYKVGECPASSRLDRWYVTTPIISWVASVAAIDLGGGSDHASVLLKFSDPDQRVRIKRRPKLYPPRACAVLAVEEVSRIELEKLKHQFDALTAEGAPAVAFVAGWEAFKKMAVSTIQTVSRDAVRKVNLSYKTKLARLRRRMRVPGLSAPTVDLLERELVTKVAAWQGLKQRRTDARMTRADHAASSAFYARAAAPRNQQPITSLQTTADAPYRGTSDLPNRMADGWRETFTQPERTNIPTIFDTHTGPSLSTACASSLAQAFTEAEVGKSLRKSKRSKSGGPDRLPNAWYRDHQELLQPILTTLFNRCAQAGIFPASFTTATIVCLPKAGRSTNPLGYRPISLLNTDYKIFMRLYTTRLKPMLPAIIAPSQSGFVPGREIHTTIDLLLGAQRHATAHGANAIAIMLDIKKAYDSLDRLFLRRCLEQRGFPSSFCIMVDAVHSDTTARFDVNGTLSAPLTMTRGIRQGCPLAPLLFIIAMDPLYRWIALDPILSEPLPATPGLLPPVAGYADDTAMYLADATKLPHAIFVLDEFAAASGLRINKDKSVVIRLNEAASPLDAACGLAVLEDHKLYRYLGAQIGNHITSAQIWKRVLQQLDVSLALAQVKTHSPAQRAVIARSVILAKILFVARHHWPDPDTVSDLDQRLRNFVWSGLFAPSTRPGTRGSRWMQSALASLSASAGGIAVPSLTLELHAMAASVVAAWAYNPFGNAAVTCALLGRDDTMLQPAFWLTDAPSPPTLNETLWNDGRSALRWIYGTRLPLPTQLLIRDAINAIRTQPREWHRECIVRDYRDFYRIAGRVILRDREELEGRLCTEWLQHLEIGDRGSALVHADGSTVKRSHLAALGDGTRLGDFIEWHRTSFGTLRFRPPFFPLTNDAATCFLLLCDTIVANFPGLLHRPDQPGRLHPLNIPSTTDVEWFIHDPGYISKYSHGFKVRTSPAATQREVQLQDAASVDGTMVRPLFACTPALTRIVMPWAGLKPWRPHRRFFKRRLGTKLTAAGLNARAARARKWEEKDDDIGRLLNRESWHSYLEARGLTTYDRQLWHRLRLHQLHVWSTERGLRPCAFDNCSKAEITGAAHTAWNCDGAQSLWHGITRLWGSPALTDAAVATAVFTRSPPDTPRDWLGVLPRTQGTTPGDRLRLWLKTLWCLLVTCALRRLWSTAVARAHGHPIAQTDDDLFATRTAWGRAVRASLTALEADPGGHLELDRHILGVLYKTLVVRSLTVPRFSGIAARYVLYFDGGSRGNPGPGGSGSVVVGLTPAPHLVWAASMAYSASTTTNNHAEYRGLCTGLDAAAEHHWHPLAVVGDSKMIIQQLSLRRRPKAGPLMQWYEQARTTADTMRVTGWHHHYRAHNKMADKAANQAMDRRASYQAFGDSTRPELNQLRELLTNDLNQWLSSTLDQEFQHNAALAAALAS